MQTLQTCSHPKLKPQAQAPHVRGSRAARHVGTKGIDGVYHHFTDWDTEALKSDYTLAPAIVSL